MPNSISDKLFYLTSYSEEAQALSRGLSKGYGMEKSSLNMHCAIIHKWKSNSPTSINGVWHIGYFFFTPPSYFFPLHRGKTSLTSHCRLLRAAVTFTEDGNFKNISRADPRNISSGVGSVTYYHSASGGNAPIIFIAVVRVKTCEIFEPVLSGNGSKYAKRFQGYMFAGEFSRAVCLHGNVSDLRVYNAPIGYGYHQFGTLYKSVDGMWNQYFDWPTCANTFALPCITERSGSASGSPRKSGSPQKSAVSAFSIPSTSSSGKSATKYLLSASDQSKIRCLKLSMALTYVYLVLRSSCVRHFNSPYVKI